MVAFPLHPILLSRHLTSHLMSASRSLNRGVLLRSSSTAMSLRGTVKKTKHQGGGHAGGPQHQAREGMGTQPQSVDWERVV